MFRLVVAMYLMIGTAVGPAACCCTLTRLATRVVPLPTSAVPKPAPCCCHTPPSEESKDEPKRPDGPGCPCKQAGGCEVVALPAAIGEAVESSTRAAYGIFHFHLSILLDRVVLSTCDSSVFREGVGTASRTTTDDLLYAFHMLRC